MVFLLYLQRNYKNICLWHEKKLLEEKEKSHYLISYMATVKPEFVALYGRRRIGKTFLVKKLYEESFDFYKTV